MFGVSRSVTQTGLIVQLIGLWNPHGFQSWSHLHVASTHHAFNMVNDEEPRAQIGSEDAGEVDVNYSSLGRNDARVVIPVDFQGQSTNNKVEW